MCYPKDGTDQDRIAWYRRQLDRGPESSWLYPEQRSDDRAGPVSPVLVLTPMTDRRLTMCEDHHGPGGDPDRAGTANWAASQIPLDDNGQHTRRPRPGPAGHNIPHRRGLWLAALTLGTLACSGNGNDDGDGVMDGRLRREMGRIDPDAAPPPRGPWMGLVLAAVAWALACVASDEDARDDPAQGRRGPVYRLFTSDGARTLRRDGPVAWYRWVFIDLDRHQPGCKWAAFLRLLTRRRLA